MATNGSVAGAGVAPTNSNHVNVVPTIPLLTPPIKSLSSPGQIGAGSAPADATGKSCTVNVNVLGSLSQLSIDVSVIENT